MKIQIINGPNLNLLGKRQPDIYGNIDFETYFKQLKIKFPSVNLTYFQSNIEGELINVLQEVQYDAFIINAGGYTHTSVAIRDCISAISAPVVEVHISNITSREEFRHTSMISPVCVGCILGFGMKSYDLAIQYFIDFPSL